MCGRFTLYADDSELVPLFEIDVLEAEHNPSYNESPGQWVRSIFEPDLPQSGQLPPAQGVGGAFESSGHNLRVMTLQRWGLVPSWAKPEFKPLINARAETLTEKPSFRAAALRRRCLIPTNGYYEWAGKQPYFLSGGEGDYRQAPVMAMAGIFEYSSWDGGLVTCAVVTREATDQLGHIHPRTPMFVPADMWKDWLNPRIDLRPEVEDLVRSIPPAVLYARQVDAAVGKVSVNDPQQIFEGESRLF